MIKRILAILGVVAGLGLLVAASVLIVNNQSTGGNTTTSDSSRYTTESILGIVETTDYSEFNPDSVIAPNALNGDLPERVIGDLSTASVVIYEYADYACSHCAEMNTALKKLVDDYGGKVAVVFRGYLLNGYPNNVAAASAASAAAIQGYWEKFKNLVFSDQATWFYLKGDKAITHFGELFVEASDGKGDLDKFYEDMKSNSVARKLAFDFAMGEAIELTGTPTFRINGEKVTAPDLQSTIDAALAK